MTKRLSVWRSDWNPETSSESTPPVDDRLPRLDDSEAQRVAEFLDAGSVVLRTTAMLPDPLSGSDVPQVRVSQRTDGVWSWDDSVTYFVRKYSISPATEFLDYVRSRNYVAQHPSAKQLDEARSELGLN